MGPAYLGRSNADEVPQNVRIEVTKLMNVFIGKVEEESFGLV